MGEIIHGERDPKPRIARVPVHGYEVATYSFGSEDEFLLCLHGGHRLLVRLRACDSRLAGGRYRVGAYDQVACGASDRPDDNSLWTLERS